MMQNRNYNKEKATLLLVDDAQSNLEILSEILNTHYTIKVAKSGKKALEIVASGGIDLILLDVIMPEMDGYEVCKRIVEDPKNKQIPIIFVTASTESEDEEKGFSYGAVDYITKPFRPTTILARVQTHLSLSLKSIELEQKVQRQSLDELTGIKSSATFFNEINNRKKALTLVLVNIDRFSDINNYYGRWYGDEILRAFAQKFSEYFGHESVYRVGGDEFAIIFNSTQADSNTIKSKLLCIENNQFFIKNISITLNLTAGLAYSGPKMVYSLAHIALKNAKDKNEKLSTFDKHQSLKNEIKKNMTMVQKIKSAIKNDCIIPNYQGIVDNRTKEITKYEALMRMVDEDGSVLSPFYFLEHAKKAKLYDTLTQIMLDKIFDEFESIKDIDFSINLTLQDIQCKETCDLLFERLEKSSVAKQAIIEIVESEGIESFEEVEKFIKKLQSFGCKIAIDDFGTGYSNFSYLCKLDVDFIKIDGSLIKDINTNRDNLLTVESILFFAQKKNIKTVAEFVENKEIFDILIKLGVDYSQGYLFSIPSLMLHQSQP